MALWKPNGSLDVGTDPADLPGAPDDSHSDAFARCKNLSLERRGRATTRAGSSRLDGQLSAAPNLLVEQGGDRYAFAGADIYKNGTSLASGLTNAQWSAIQYNQLNDTDQQIFALNGTDRKRINGNDSQIFEWGIEAPSAAPTLGVGGSTGLTGTYKVRITYARKVGSTVVSESNPSPASDGQALSNESLDVTWAASSDTQVTHVRVYRTLANGGVYFFDQDVAVGAVTVDTNTADTALAGEVATNHDRPPSAGTLVAGPFFGGICFIADGNKLHYCLAKSPEYWPATNFVEVGSKQFPIKAIVEARGQVFLLTKQKLWTLQGTTGGAFQPVPLGSLAGAPNQFSAVSVEGKGLYHVGYDGIYVWSGGRDQKLTQTAFDPIFTGVSAGGIPAVTGTHRDASWLVQFGNRLFFHWAYGSVLVFNLDTNRTTFYQYDEQLYAPVVDLKNDRLLVGDAGKFIRELETGTTDPGGNIAWEAQTKDFSRQTWKHFPRWIKYDVNGTASGNLYLDGVLHQAHKAVGDNTKRRLIKTGNGDRCAIRLTGTGVATLFALEFS